MIKKATFCTGIGSPEFAIEETGVEHEIVFACEIDKYARASYQSRFKPKRMLEDMTQVDFSDPELYSDLVVAGLPCQAFSIAGKRLGELDKRGILIYNFHDYVKKQQPKAFILENVKGLKSINKGEIFENWQRILGRSVNGVPIENMHPDSLEYNLYWKVLNTKNFDLPQNRERVFIVGIRKDLPANYAFPENRELKIRLRDVLEENVAEKYYLSDKMLAGLRAHQERSNELGRGFNFNPTDGEGTAKCIRANNFKMGPDDNYIKTACHNRLQIVGNLPVGNDMRGRVYSSEGIAPCITSSERGGKQPLIRIAGWHENENIIAAHMGDAKRSTVSEHVYHKPEGVCNTIQTAHVPKVITNRIRRLTPLECWRLQGYSDEYFYQAQSAPMSDTQLYKQAGNSISTTVIKAVMEPLINLIELSDLL